MRLDHLHLQNFRCYEDARFDFNPHFNLVVGVNGSGKTSLLQAVAMSFVEFISYFKPDFIGLDQQDVRLTANKINGKIRYEKKFPATIKAEGEITRKLKWAITQANDNQPYLVENEFSDICQALVKAIGSESSTDLPTIAFYRANRRIKKSMVTPETAAQQRLSRLDGYTGWFDATADLQDFESWVISKTLERMQNLLEGDDGTQSSWDELTLVNKAVTQAIPQASDLRYDLRMRSLVIDMNGTAAVFDQLSDGQRGLIALMADIARRMCVLNPHLGDLALIKSPGIILIDELDMHLHPAWQRHIVQTLRQAFPSIQFVAASHSPQIIGSLKPEEVILLHDGDSRHPRVTYGLDSSTVLEEVMGTSQREPEIEDMLHDLFSTLEDNDVKKAKLMLRALKSVAPDLPEFAGAEALIRRKEILGK